MPRKGSVILFEEPSNSDAQIFRHQTIDDGIQYDWDRLKEFGIDDDSDCCVRLNQVLQGESKLWKHDKKKKQF